MLISVILNKCFYLLNVLNLYLNSIHSKSKIYNNTKKIKKVIRFANI